MLRYKSAWMPVAGTAEDQMQSYSGESQLERRELAAGTRAGAWGRARIESGGRFSPHIRHLTAPRIVWAQPANRRLLFRNFERSLYLDISPRIPRRPVVRRVVRPAERRPPPSGSAGARADRDPPTAPAQISAVCGVRSTHLEVCVRRV